MKLPRISDYKSREKYAHDCTISEYERVDQSHRRYNEAEDRLAQKFKEALARFDRNSSHSSV